MGLLFAIGIVEALGVYYRKPWWVARQMLGKASKSEVTLTIDGKLTQSGGIKLMMYKPDQILAALSSFMTLEDGDIVMTGTPKGVGEVHQGDLFLGRLKCGEQTLVEIEWVAK